MSPQMSKAHAEFGVNESGRVECQRNPRNHGFHPADEDCTYCLPAPTSVPVECDEGYWHGSFYKHGG